MTGAVADVLLYILDLYNYVIIAAVIVSWLTAFGVINVYNPFARSVVQVLHALTEPLFRPLRRLLPPMGGLDLTPLIALVIVYFLQRLIVRTMY